MRSNSISFRRSLPLILLLAGSAVMAADPWPAMTLADPKQVELGGSMGTALQRGIDRLAQPPYTLDWLLADVSFKIGRIFTNYSGDVSGRFLELAALTSPSGRYSPPTLEGALAGIAQYQKADGHFGAEMDFAKPMQKLSPPIPMLWGNARLLVGLVTAARECHNTNLLAAARRLGDFYISSANVFCSPAREAELRATGTGGDSYTCCYFPAIEGLALLYRATHEQRYLDQARRMAEWFRKFDALPTDHSHGNLCAWRGILELYQITGDRSYLDRALIKWQSAVQDGFVWTLGGIGEHWYILHSGDEGCSESDWLRFNLELWRDTGETRFLDMAERLLHNQYAANQCPNGGYGWRHFDGVPAGPVGTRGAVEEWNFCCSFHGPLGLHFLKSYLATGSERGVYVSFPLDFRATVRADGRDWRVTTRTRPPQPGRRELDIELAAANGTPARTTLWLRKPNWADAVQFTGASGAAIPFTEDHGYVRLQHEFKAGESLRVAFLTGLRIERRRFETVRLEPGKLARLPDVAILDGPDVLFAAPAPSSGRMTLLALLEDGGVTASRESTALSGRLRLLELPQGGPVTVALPGLDSGLDQITAALASGRPVSLRPEAEQRTQRRTTFAHDLIVVPAGQLPASPLAAFVTRASETAQVQPGPCYGERLENNPDAWLPAAGWQFSSNSLHVTGGDIGLLDGQGYADYRFEFDLELPMEGQGITGWIVRAADPNNCLHFQLQSADSTFNRPEYKTRPNTLRPHVRRNGEWTIADPMPLPKEIRRGESHHIAVECRGTQITVFLDGQKIFTQEDAGCHAGSVGFRAAGSPEQGRFSNISLRRL